MTDSIYILPDELRGAATEINACIARGREIALACTTGARDREKLSVDEKTILGLTALVHAFHEKINEIENVLHVGAKDHSDALHRLVRAKLTLDALRERYRGFVQLEQHQMGAGMMAAVDAMERALSTGEKSLAEYVKESLSESSVKLEDFKL